MPKPTKGTVVPNRFQPVMIDTVDREALFGGLISAGHTVEYARVQADTLPSTDGALQMLARHREASTAALTAEIQRLREALREADEMLAFWPENPDDLSGDLSSAADAVRSRITAATRAALSTPSEVSNQTQALEGKSSFSTSVGVLGPHQHQWAYGTATGGLSCVKCQETRAYDHPDTQAYLAQLQRGQTTYRVSEPVADESGGEGESFQQRVQPWLMACFGEMIAGDREERNHRFLEEALELVQACGCSASEAHQLVDYVFGRDIGEPTQEVGGVMVTLAALCLANGLDMHANGETELARIWTKVEAIRAKQAAKPKHSPLPQHVATPPNPTNGDAVEDSDEEIVPVPLSAAQAAEDQALGVWPRSEDRVLNNINRSLRLAFMEGFYFAHFYDESILALRKDNRKLREALDWFSGQHRLSLQYYASPVPEGASEDTGWQVFRESGSSDELQLDIVGRGKSLIDAIQSALATLAKHGGAEG
ncbi:IS110 family transposase [Sphingomonas sp. R1]|uniref:IS110 family transposase n=1 Tax=Sphingomonas sp. R1 TaxID=399176 RepID=UPI0022241C8F|nr:IS110 family transposase [Sphingomonas sp. R1]UYY77762.1 IS110 family transposase [Sphingomonas sp. R1]